MILQQPLLELGVHLLGQALQRMRGGHDDRGEIVRVALAIGSYTKKMAALTKMSMNMSRVSAIVITVRPIRDPGQSVTPLSPGA